MAESESTCASADAVAVVRDPPVERRPSTADPVTINTGIPSQEAQSSSASVEKIPDEEDDDILFIFSAPKRQKKKRRILESDASPSSVQENPSTTTNRPSQVGEAISDPSARRGTTSMVQGLESCHIDGEEDKKPVLVRRDSLPTVPPPVPSSEVPVTDPVTTSISMFDPTTEPNFVAMNSDTPLTDSSSIQWWNNPPSGPLMINPFQSNWNGSHREDNTGSNKRKRDEIPDNTGQQNDLEEQISPRTKPASPRLNSFSAFQNPNANVFGIGRTQAEMPSIFTAPKLPAWPPSWNHFPQAPSQQSRSQCSSPRNLMRGPYQSPYQKLPVVPPNVSSWSSSESLRPRAPSENETAFNKVAYPFVPLQKDALVTPDRPLFGGFQFQDFDRSTPASYQQNSRIFQRKSPSPHRVSLKPHQPSAQHQVLPPKVPTPAPQPTPTVENPNDIIRRPSLYKIPAWSPPLHNNHQTSSQSPDTSLNDTAMGSEYSQPSRNFMQSQLHPSDPRTPALSSTQHPFQPHPYSPILPHPTSASSRKYSPNLIVDIAETAQQTFPYEILAERHNVPLQKVFDTFSAIIQLPLLRNADDKRRHGSLGKRRMKEFKDAKRAMERDREAKLNAERDGWEREESRRGRGKPRESGNGSMGLRDGMIHGQGGMRRHAILNSFKEGRRY